MPFRSQRLIEQVLGLLGDRLHFQLARLLRRLEEFLDERVRMEQDNELLADWLASRAAIRRGYIEFVPAFMASLRKECEGAYERLGPPGAGGFLAGLIEPLRLLDAGIVDEEGALAGIAARHDSRASLHLVLLGQRFAVLLERPPLSAEELPIGPYAFGRALRHAASTIGIPLHGRMALYRHYDLEHIERFETLMQAADALLDSAGVLRGLSFVPLRQRDVPDHPMRGRAPAASAAPAEPFEPADASSSAATGTPEIVAVRVVNQALDRIVPPGTLPEDRLDDRRDAVSAMVRLVCRYGADSPEWARCQAVVAEAIEAARDKRPASAESAAWIRDSLQALHYDPGEVRRLSLALAHLGAAQAPDAHPHDDAGETMQHWQQRLAGLPEGTTLGFTRQGGVTRARLRRRGAARDRLLLASEDEGKEAWVTVETIARLMAEGHAWVVQAKGGSQ